MKERLLNILDQSTCLTRRQMKDYLAGTMLPEEIHAAETHIASCPLCSMAVEGFDAHSDEALEAISSLNSGFLKEHFDSITPQIHLNSMAPAIPVAHHPHTKKKKSRPFPIFKIAAAAAALVIGFGIMWLLGRNDRKEAAQPVIAQQESPPPAPQQSVAAGAPVGRSETDRKTQDKEMLSTSQANQQLPEKKAVAGENNAAQDDGPSWAAAAPPAEPVVQEDVKAIRSSANQDSISQHTYEWRLNQPARYGGNAYAAESAPANANFSQNRYNTNVDALTRMARKEAAKPVPVDAKKPAGRTRSADSVTMYSAAALEKAKKDTREKEKREAAAKTDGSDEDHLLGKADDLYGKGNYRAALTKYTAAMNSASRRERADATLMAAKCYRNLGNKAKAISLLQQMIDNGGPNKRAARRMLDELKNE